MPHVSPAPLLSICIPAYNGAQYLERLLEALLPQALEAGSEVEVLVIDDASTDNTAEVVAAARRHGPVCYTRNPVNLRSARNIVKGPVELATGEFVWGLSQHCLIHPGALARLLRILRVHRHLDGFYVNFCAADYPQDWPLEAVGGHTGRHKYFHNEDLRSRELERWEDMLEPKKWLDGTQCYVHILRRSLWKNYWAGRTIGEDFTSVHTTFPHTCTVAGSLFGKPAYYVGEPLLTMFDGAQWWGSLKNRARVYLVGYPPLIQLYRSLGLQRSKLRESQEHCSQYAYGLMVEVFRDWPPEERRIVFGYLWKYWHYQGTLRAVWRAFMDSKCCWLARALPRCGARLARIYQYCFCNCRPARWIRAHLAKREA
jgi:glycosyltransferase involved in cell wall biosynthesis